MSIFLIFLVIVISFSQRFFWKSLHGHMERWLPGKTSDMSLVMYAGYFNHLVCLNPSIGYNIAFIFECNAHLSRIQEKNCCYFRFIASLLTFKHVCLIFGKCSTKSIRHLFVKIDFVSASIASKILWCCIFASKILRSCRWLLTGLSQKKSLKIFWFLQ